VPEASAVPFGLGAALLCALSFLMGAIPFGPLLARRKGVDLRKVGSGNTGATNVLRSVGKGAALLTLLGDALKGTAAVALARAFGLGPFYEGLFGLLAVLGHDFSPFMGFRGGKGVATSLGVILLYVPEVGILTLIVWVATVLVTRVSSLGALVSFALLPAAVAALGGGKEELAFSTALTALIVVRHAGNIRRLIKGTERRVGEKAP
jgi:glycerol-3-phosphate acyltransferase PlsY